MAANPANGVWQTDNNLANLINAAGQLMGGLGTDAMTAGGKVVDTTVNAFKGLGNMVVGAGKTIWNAGKTAVETVGHAAGVAWNGIVDTATNAYNGITDIYSGAKNVVTKGWQAFKGAVLDPVGKAFNEGVKENQEKRALPDTPTVTEASNDMQYN